MSEITQKSISKQRDKILKSVWVLDPKMDRLLVLFKATEDLKERNGRSSDDTYCLFRRLLATQMKSH